MPKSFDESLQLELRSAMFRLKRLSRLRVVHYCQSQDIKLTASRHCVGHQAAISAAYDSGFWSSVLAMNFFSLSTPLRCSVIKQQQPFINHRVCCRKVSYEEHPIEAASAKKLALPHNNTSRLSARNLLSEHSL